MVNSLQGQKKGHGDSAAPVVFTAHPPERNVSGLPLLCAGCGCCCCCCCCLHSIGGLSLSLTVPADVVQDDSRAPRSLLPSVDVRARYFQVLGIVSLVIVGVGLLIVGLPLLLVTFPLFQLFASLIVLVTLQKLPKEERPRARWQLARLTLRAFLGSLAGLFLMLALFGILVR